MKRKFAVVVGVVVIGFFAIRQHNISSYETKISERSNQAVQDFINHTGYEGFQRICESQIADNLARQEIDVDFINKEITIHNKTFSGFHFNKVFISEPTNNKQGAIIIDGLNDNGDYLSVNRLDSGYTAVSLQSKGRFVDYVVCDTSSN